MKFCVDRYGNQKVLPPAFHDIVDLLEKHYDVLFNTQVWRWNKV